MSRSFSLRRLASASFFMLTPVFGAGIPTGTPLEEIVVTATRRGLVGESRAASEGIVGSTQIAGRPIFRPGEVLEVVPGLIVTQHSGDGKANQYFLRGFNLDHGTDFATYVDGVPVNMPTHAHGQGYTDINFLIHELIDDVHYRKGPYYAEEGNFSAAGVARIAYREDIGAPKLSLTVGQDDYARLLAAASPDLAGGTLLMGVAWSQGDGPWILPQDFGKTSGVIKYTRGDASRGFAITGMGYDGDWTSTDQIPQRAVDSGLIDRFGYVDDTSGGESHRYSLSADGWTRDETQGWSFLAYAIDYYLDLFSNFTYAIDQENGDQFEQNDDRQVYGGRVVYDRMASFTDHQGVLRAGTEIRQDEIEPVALFLTTARERHATIRKDDVSQGQYSGFVSHEQRWNSWLRTDVGLRLDYFDFSVDSDIPANSGNESSHLWQSKASIVVGPWNETEFFINAGRGFHANDARGTTIRVDPTDGLTPVEPVDPIVPADGAELGVRSAVVPEFQLTAALWGLDIDSELLFVGDGGITEPSRATRRYGVELGAYWTPLEWIIVDADYAWSHARFTESDPVGDYIPGAPENVASLGITVDRQTGWHGGARWRYLGSVPLLEDNSVRSSTSSIVNAEVGYHITRQLSLMATVFNLFDSDDNDIAYYYESQLPNETEPVADIHFHPMEPRTLRVEATYQF